MRSSATGSSSWATTTGSTAGRIAMESPQSGLSLRNYAACRGARGATTLEAPSVTHAEFFLALQRHCVAAKISRSERRTKMSMHRRLDPELAAPLEAWSQAMQGGMNLHDIPAARRLMEDLAAAQMAKA